MKSGISRQDPVEEKNKIKNDWNFIEVGGNGSNECLSDVSKFLR